MPVEISNIEGSLKGFDIVLALSEEAINASLQKLYDTAITDGPLPPPLLLPDFAPSPQATHFINHRLSLHRLNSKKSTPEKPVYLEAGIEGWIECPSVRFRPILDLGPSVSADAKYKNASVEIKFKKGPDGTSSFIKYYDREQESYDTLCLDGKTMAWSVKIGRLDVQDVMNDIIKKTVHNPPADEQLKKHVDSNVFTVSTVFCVFEHQEMVNTFTMLDENRKTMTGDVTANAMADITGYFLGIQQTHGSSQIPENPFILGYGISQSPPDESRERATALAATALPYFIPKQFVLTVTPGDGIGQQWNTTSGTLNFCMLTQREGQYDRIDISPTDANAGLFDKTFFDITKTLGKTKDDTGKIQGHDGIMAFSRQVMEDLWLRKIVQDIRLPLNDKFRDMINDGFWKRVGFADLLVSQGDGLQKADHGYKSYQTWQTGTVGMDESDPYSKQQFAFGESIAQATINSETANIQSVRDGINHARNLYLDIKTENRMTYVFQTHGINTMFVNEDKDRNWWSRRDGTPYPDQNKLKNYLNQGHWMLARTIELTVRSFVRLNIHAGRDGQWDIDVDESKSKNLFKPGEDLKFSAVADYQALPSFDNMTEYGNFYQFEKHNTYITCGQREADLHFTDSMKGWKTKSSQTVRDSLEGVVKGLGGCVIMPAGDVFSFAGLDTDDKGTVYAQCDYKNESGHKKT